jgi:hypothetical protein
MLARACLAGAPSQAAVSDAMDSPAAASRSEAVVDEERASVVGCVCKTVLMIGLQRTVHEAAVIRNQLQVATDRPGG